MVHQLTFGIQAIHHGLYDIQFILDREVDEVGIHKDMIWWPKLCIIPEKQC